MADPTKPKTAAEIAAEKEEAANTLYNENVEIAAKYANWDDKLLGLFKKSSEETPEPIEMKKFTSEFKKLVDDGMVSNKKTGNRNIGRFYSDVDKQKRENEQNHITTNKTDIYKEAHVAAKAELLKNVKKSRWERLFNWMHKPKNSARYKQFIDNQTELIIKKDELITLDGTILVTQGMLKLAEDLQAADENTITIERVERHLLQIQELTKQRIQKITPIKKLESENNELWTEVLDELEEEKNAIRKNFDVKIDNILRRRQMLIKEIDGYSTGNSRHELPRRKLREEIDSCDIKLEKLKNKLIEYKSKRPIFLFEDLLGAQSTPLI